MTMARKRKCSTPLSEDGKDYDSDKSGDKPPIVRNAANARERARMRVLSKAFTRLKTTLPWVPSDTKLSKLDTLRLASCYIAHLRQILEEDQTECSSRSADSTTATPQGPGPNSPDGPIHPINLTWPFTFNGKVQANPAEIRRKDANALLQMSGKAEVTSS